MCGIFGIISPSVVDDGDLHFLAKFAERRGKDSSGLVIFSKQSEVFEIHRRDASLKSLLGSVQYRNAQMVIGHSRLITNGLHDNQPINRDSVVVLHNGIIVNDGELWERSGRARQLQVDTEVLAALAADAMESGATLTEMAEHILASVRGVVACALAFPKLGKLVLFSNNGSLYYGMKGGQEYFYSEEHPLISIGCSNVKQIRGVPVIINIPQAEVLEVEYDNKFVKRNLIPELGSNKFEESLLEYRSHALRRCTKCILPETMPFIRFDDAGVCNYCKNYTLRNRPRPVGDLLEVVDRYRRNGTDDCIVPFSGGRDSCFGLHLVCKTLHLKPIAYTYDWGMVTDLGRRNISRMCAQLGVENIIVADDISRKRRNIALNFKAWLKNPNLGMVSILTAGDKHFFRHVETVKKETGISLNLWGVNPLEVTHFKAGFLGVAPDFEEKRVYNSGLFKQIGYQFKRLKAMSESPGYFNRSLWDTLSGEYYRSFHRKSDYYHLFDFWRWDEGEIDRVLLSEYDWERAVDTNTTWRIGDGTAAIYNYIYYTVAGFTEHDTFRSNQIREGDITRERALELVKDENRPRYPNIKWYFDAIGLEFSESIKTINRIPKLY